MRTMWRSGSRRRGRGEDGAVDGRRVDDAVVGLRGRGVVVGGGEGGRGPDLGGAYIRPAAAPPSSASAQRRRAAPAQVLVLLLVLRC
jgi:hypothetical protein